MLLTRGVVNHVGLSTTSCYSSSFHIHDECKYQSKPSCAFAIGIFLNGPVSVGLPPGYDRQFVWLPACPATTATSHSGTINHKL